MKLYIKANNLKILKNIDTLLPSNLSKTATLLDVNSLHEYRANLQSVRVFYKSLGVGRFSLENVGVDVSFLPQTPKMQVDLYYPHITLANSKACDIAGSFEDERGYFVFNECSKYCNFASLEFTHSDILGIRQRYNTLYKTDIGLEVQRVLYKESKNRLVWELFL